MTRARRLLPATNLARIRLAAVLIGCLALVSDLVQTGSPANQPIWNTMGVLSILLIMAALVLTYLRDSAPWWDSLSLPVLIAIGGSSLVDPIATIALALAMTMVLSLYGPTPLWIIRTLGAFLAVPAAIAINPHSLDRVFSWYSPTVLGLLPQLLLMSVMMRGIYLAIRHQERAGARDAVLAATGSKMLGAADVDAVRDLGRQAAEQIIALTGGTCMVIVRRNATGLYLHNLAGLPADLLGTPVPEAMITDPTLITGLAPQFRHWKIESYSADLYQFVGGRRPVRDEVVDAFRTIANQVVLAEAAIRSHAELDHQANHDHLTQLPTRARFFRQLAAAVDTSAPGTVALLNIDLDDFKTVNDTYGHGAGDELLVEVAARLQRAAGPGAVAARFGGDEFAVLLTGLRGPDDAVRIADRICEQLIAPQQLSGSTVAVGASIGLAVAATGYTAADLTRCADIAMYSAKAQGKNQVERFDPARHGDIARHRTVEHHLGDALAREEIVLRYAPWVDPRTGECVGVEALAYWEHPTFGTLGPAELLRLAGHTGDLPALSRHLLRSACAQIAAVPGAAGLRLGIDVTARQLLDSAFADEVIDIVTRAGLQPSRLTLEIVDSDGIETAQRLTTLAGHGVRIALDAANTATATVRSLAGRPVDQLTVDAGDPAALELVLALGRALGTRTVVGRVATIAELYRLRGTAVAAVQGAAVAEPMPAADLAGWLARQPALV